MGCIVYDGPIPTISKTASSARASRSRSTTCSAPATPSCRASCAAGSGRDRSRPAATWANACGAFAVSRLLCAPEYPTWTELQFFLEHGSKEAGAAQGRGDQPHPLGDDAPARHPVADGARHRPSHPARGRSREAGAARQASRAFKVLAVKAAAQVAAGRAGLSACCSTTTMAARRCSTPREHRLLWIGRPVELPGSRPLRFEFSQDSAASSIEWPVDHCIKVPVLLSPGRSGGAEGASSSEKLRAAYDAARKVGRELLIEIIAGKHGTLDDTTIPRALAELYALGIKPDWWKLEPQASGRRLGRRSRRSSKHDPYAAASCCSASKRRRTSWKRPSPRLPSAPHRQGLRRRPHDLRRRGRAWLAGKMSDDEAVADMAARFETADRGMACRAWPQGGIRRARLRRKTTMTQDHPPDHGAGAGALPEPADDRDRRQDSADLRRRLRDLRARQCRRHRRGALPGARRAADLSRPQRAGHGACRDRLRQGQLPPPLHGGDLLDRAGRAPTW